MARKEKSVNVVLVGFGWTASIIAQELTDAGLEVLALERGGDRTTQDAHATTFAQDELRFAIRNDLFEPPAKNTITFRNNGSQTALPMRHLGSFNPGIGVGGAGVHWNGQTWRFLPTDFRQRSHIVERYGAAFIPEGMAIQDWGVTYEELEPHYDKFEYVCGISGTAGNIKGAIQPGGNPFEGPRSRGYPLPPLKRSLATTLFRKAATEVGFTPFPAPAANLSEPYTNPYGVPMGECTYCGFCEWHGCGNYSKSTPQTTILPVLLGKKNFSYRVNANVTKVNLDRTGRRATGVTYIDSKGDEVEQPAEIVILCAYATHNVHLMLLSGIGTAYDPQARQGVVGRNYAYQMMSGINVFTNQNMNPFMGAGALGEVIDDFNGDNFDHSKEGFIGGGFIGTFSTGGRPIGQMRMPADAPKWGAGWKTAAKENYSSSLGITCHGSVMSYDDVTLDLDPTYKNVYGSPLMRMTFDYHDNERKMSRFITAQAEKIAKAMGAKSYDVGQREGPYSIVPYQTTHNTGGATMGADPKTSALNRYLQSWDVSNVFVPGANAFPQNAGYNPTGTVAALSYWMADAIKTRYMKSPGPLVQV